MKALLRTLLFSYIALYLTQQIIGGLSFGDNYNINLLLVLVALTILNLFIFPILKILALPVKGPGFLFLRFVLNLVVLFVLTFFIPGFSIEPTFVSELLFFGIVLPSKSLSPQGALIFSSLLFVIILNFFMWLCAKKK